MDWNDLDALRPNNVGTAVGSLQQYFGLGKHEGRSYSGSRFERLGTPDAQPHEFTPEDLLAPALLSVPVNGLTVRLFLEDEKFRREVRGLLETIPVTLDLSNPNDTQARDQLTDRNSPLSELWKLIKTIKGVGSVRVSKLLARKRPHLVPIYDKIVARGIGLDNDAEHWNVMAALFNQGALRDRLNELRFDAKVPKEVSLLRVLDVTIWMHERP